MDKAERKKIFEKTIEQHKGILFKVARAYCYDEDDRQDLIQEMMIQIWQSIHRYHAQHKISTWLYRVALNVAISFYRKNSRRANTFTSINEENCNAKTDEHTGNDDQLYQLEQFINELKELDKAIMILYLDEKSHREISDILGISVSNVGTKIGRIKDQLKQKFTKTNSTPL